MSLERTRVEIEPPSSLSDGSAVQSRISWKVTCRKVGIKLNYIKCTKNNLLGLVRPPKESPRLRRPGIKNLLGPCYTFEKWLIASISTMEMMPHHHSSNFLVI